MKNGPLTVSTRKHPLGEATGAILPFAILFLFIILIQIIIEYKRSVHDNEIESHEINFTRAAPYITVQGLL